MSDFVFRGLAEKRALMERVALISRESFEYLFHLRHLFDSSTTISGQNGIEKIWLSIAYHLNR